ncbi:enolase C-terminal domain-like protein [Candidatus Laterigemmans baculatus]|uniref:enolase C-terminal domain-like protein n=1 Tax=Candidatus Laterigemmans baculatus TaxID=2770505 RepID=UPI0013DB0FFD|nr:enolase C-terminal domain-like protein [Candidatus Laterigemmans baculatus]
MKDSDLASYQLQLDTELFGYRAPMKFGGRVVTDAVLMNVVCVASTRDGKRGIGFGSMTAGVAWAWPSQTLAADQTLSVVLELAARLVQDAAETQVAGHPLEICWAAAERRDAIAEKLEAELELPEPIPPLARLLAASPLEAALFDAHGKAAGRSSFAMLGPEYLEGDLSRFLGSDFAGLTLDEFVAAEPRPSMPLYHLVGALDPLVAEDVTNPLGDGLPETLAEWIRRDGLTHLKIKLDGSDAAWDLQRVQRISETADEGPRGADAEWSFSLDFNERCQDEAYVLQLLDSLEEQTPRALERIRYIEQPTHRDLHLHPHNTMHRVAARLPVVIDESLINYESLLLARQQGYSGVAIKACKGHAEALLMAAAARHHQMYLCVQDLTCVAAGFLHSASLTAHLPGAAAIEGNGRQYCPSANVAWSGDYPGLFDVREGVLPTSQLAGPGLGYATPQAVLEKYA